MPHAHTRLAQDLTERLRGARDGQVRDVEVPHARAHQGANRQRADIRGIETAGKIGDEPFDGHRQELAQHGQRLRVGAPVVEHAEHARHRDAPLPGLLQEPLNEAGVVMRHDLRQVELAGERRAGQQVGLPGRIGVRIGPPAQGQTRQALADGLPQLPRVLHAARRAHVFVAAEHDERRKPLLGRPVSVCKAIVQRVLRRQERHHAVPRRVGSQIGDQVPQVVFFGRAHGAVGQEHHGPVARQPPHGVVGVDPRVHALVRL
jgi:hypothetical protein